MLELVILFSLAAAPEAADSENAWAEWSRWEEFMDPVESLRFDPIGAFPSLLPANPEHL